MSKTIARAYKASEMDLNRKLEMSNSGLDSVDRHEIWEFGALRDGSMCGSLIPPRVSLTLFSVFR